MSWVIFQKSVPLVGKYGEIGEFEKQFWPKSSKSRNNSECTENLEFANGNYPSDGDTLGFPSVPDAQNSNIIWSNQIRNDQKENEQRQWNSPSVHAMRPTILHCQGRSYSPRSGYARRAEPRRSYPRHSYPRRSYRRSYSRQSYSRRSYSPPRDYQVWGPALCWETHRPDRWKLLQSPGSHKERRSPCRRESRSCSRLGCQVLLWSLTVLELSRSNSQVQGLVTREPSVGLEGLGEMWVVGFRIGYLIHVE